MSQVKFYKGLENDLLINNAPENQDGFYLTSDSNRLYTFNGTSYCVINNSNLIPGTGINSVCQVQPDSFLYHQGKSDERRITISEEQKAIATHESSISLGLGTQSTDVGSIAIGSFAVVDDVKNDDGTWTQTLIPTKATGRASFAVGAGTWAENSTSFAMGGQTHSSGQGAFAGGYGSIASGNTSFAMGSSANASGVASISMGSNTNALGNVSVAIGYYSDATFESSFAIGHKCKTTAAYSVAIGCEAKAEGYRSIAIGNLVKTNYNYSTAIGYNTKALATGSTSIGYNCTTSGKYSTAIGYESSTNSNYSSAFGSNVTADKEYQFVVGTYNKVDYNAQFIVGAGTNDKPKNCFTAGFDSTSNSSYITIGNIKLTSNQLSSIEGHIDNKNNPHSVTKSQVGLENVDNTSDANKPISNAQATAIADAKQAGTNAQSDLDAFKGTVQTNISALQTSISAEETARINKDNSLQSEIDFLNSCAVISKNGLWFDLGTKCLDSIHSNKNFVASEYTIPSISGITKIEDNVFKDYTVNYNDLMTGDDDHLYWSPLINIPDNITEIGESSFENSTVQGIKCLHRLHKIGKDAFRNASLNYQSGDYTADILKADIYEDGCYYGVDVIDGIMERGSSAEFHLENSVSIGQDSFYIIMDIAHETNTSGACEANIYLNGVDPNNISDHAFCIDYNYDSAASTINVYTDLTEYEVDPIYGHNYYDNIWLNKFGCDSDMGTVWDVNVLCTCGSITFKLWYKDVDGQYFSYVSNTYSF